MNSLVDLAKIFITPESIEGQYATAKAESAALDDRIGFRVEKIEAELVKKHEGSHAREKSKSWIGLEPQVLQTPYSEISFMLAQLSLEPDSLIVDLGAAYGRMGLVVGAKYPTCSFLGYESVRERVTEGNRVLKKFGIANAKLECQDLTETRFQIPPASIYFIYDFCPEVSAVESVLEKLKVISQREGIVVVGRGRLVRDLIERQHPWLSQVVEPEHFSNFTIYRS